MAHGLVCDKIHNHLLYQNNACLREVRYKEGIADKIKTLFSVLKEILCIKLYLIPQQPCDFGIIPNLVMKELKFITLVYLIQVHAPGQESKWV